MVIDIPTVEKGAYYMKNKMKLLNGITIIIITLSLTQFGCSSSEDPEFKISLTTNPTVVSAGETIELEISVEEHDTGGMGGLSMHGQIHLPNNAGEVDIDFVESADQVGHYSAEYVFETAATYELHCSFTHEGETVEKEFIIEVH